MSSKDLNEHRHIRRPLEAYITRDFGLCCGAGAWQRIAEEGFGLGIDSFISSSSPALLSDSEP
jgi:hypothetical protein